MPASGQLRLLMLGPVNTVHVAHHAVALQEAGLDVMVAGDRWPSVVGGGELEQAGIPVRAVSRGLTAFFRRLMREFRPDVVHAHWLTYAARALLARARPLVAQPWGSDVYAATPRLRLANRVVARGADRIVADSSDLALELQRLGAAERRCEVINWGVDLERFTPPDEAGRAAAKARLGLGSGPVVLSPRAVTPRYNPRVILEAFSLVRQRVPEAQLALKHFQSEVPPELLPLPEGVRVMGQVPYDELPDWYRAADVCVSIPSTDSSPRSVWEAMACGAPCVVSDLPWAREEMTPEEHALVVPVDAAAVAEAILRVLADRALATRLASAAHALVERTRDRATETRRLVRLYETLAAR